MTNVLKKRNRIPLYNKHLLVIITIFYNRYKGIHIILMLLINIKYYVSII